MKKGLTSCLLVAFLVLGSVTAFGYHDTLYVVVNGIRLTPTQIQALERLHGGPILSGRYWLDTNTGVWGVEGGGPQGRLGNSAYQPSRQPSPPSFFGTNPGGPRLW